MSARPALLFIINGFGLGNSTRCSALIEILTEQGFEIDVLSFGRGYDFFTRDRNVRSVIKTAPLTYGNSENTAEKIADEGVRVGRLLKALPQLSVGIARQVSKLKQTLAQSNYCGLVTDSDYSVGFLKPWIRVPVFCINNSAEVAGRWGAWKEFPHSQRTTLLGHWLVELLDAEWHRRVADRILSPGWTEQSQIQGKKLLLPPLVRTSKVDRSGTRSRDPSTSTRKLLVIAGGSGLGWKSGELECLRNWPELTTAVVGLDGESDDSLRFLGWRQDLVELVRASDLLLLNGGLSSLSEASVYGKPAVVVPIEGHAEQYLNARALAQLGRARTATRKTWPKELQILLREFGEYSQRCGEAIDPSLGARIAGCAIVEHLRAME